MDKEDFDNDIFCLNITDESEGDSSSSSAPYETNAFVLDLHKTTKENSNPGIVKTVKKVKKKKRKRSQASESSDSTSKSITPASAPPTLDEQAKEEFFDAHESYYDIPATQVFTPVGPVALAQALSDHDQGLLDTTIFAEKLPESTLLELPKVTEKNILVLKSSDTIVLDKPKEDTPSQEQTPETKETTVIDSNVTDIKVFDAAAPNLTVIDTKLPNTTGLDKVHVLESTPSQGQTMEAQKQPSAITKPVTGPE